MFHIDYRDARPIYEQVMDGLRRLMVTGVIAEGEKLPSVRALDGLTMTVEKGCIYGLVGPNGAGKSTILRHITGIYRPDSGCVLVDGQPVYEIPPSRPGSSPSPTSCTTSTPPPPGT